MHDEVLTTQGLLEQWREATRAAELAERLAKLAAESAARADQAAVGSEEIARMAERMAKAADRAALSARNAADQAATYARENPAGTLADAAQSVVDTRTEETAAGERSTEPSRQPGRDMALSERAGQPVEPPPLGRSHHGAAA